MSRLILCGIASGLVLVFTTPARADDDDTEKVVKRVEDLGGSVERDEGSPGKPVIGVKLTSCKATDADVAELRTFEFLTHLNLGDTLVTDAGLKKVAQLDSLTTLELGHTAITDKGLKELASLRLLTELGLGSPA